MDLISQILNQERTWLQPFKSPRAEPPIPTPKSFVESGFKLPEIPKNNRDFARNYGRLYEGEARFMELVDKHVGDNPFSSSTILELGNFLNSTPSRLVKLGKLKYLKRGNRWDPPIFQRVNKPSKISSG